MRREWLNYFEKKRKTKKFGNVGGKVAGGELHKRTDDCVNAAAANAAAALAADDVRKSLVHTRLKLYTDLFLKIHVKYVSFLKI